MVTEAERGFVGLLGGLRGASWEPFELPWGPRGATWRALGGLLRASWELLEVSWVVLWGAEGPEGAILAILGAS